MSPEDDPGSHAVGSEVVVGGELGGIEVEREVFAVGAVAAAPVFDGGLDGEGAVEVVVVSAARGEVDVAAGGDVGIDGVGFVAAGDFHSGGGGVFDFVVVAADGIEGFEGEFEARIEVKFGVFVEVFFVIGDGVGVSESFEAVAEVFHGAADAAVRVEEGHSEGTSGPGHGVGVTVAGPAVSAGDRSAVFVVILFEFDDFETGPAIGAVDGVEPEFVDDAGVDEFMEIEEAGGVFGVLEAVVLGELVGVEGGIVAVEVLGRVFLAWEEGAGLMGEFLGDGFIAEVDVFEDLVLEEWGCVGVFEAVVTGGFSEGLDELVGMGLDGGHVDVVGEVKDEDAGLHFADLVVVLDEPGVGVGGGELVGPDGGVIGESGLGEKGCGEEDEQDGEGNGGGADDGVMGGVAQMSVHGTAPIRDWRAAL